MEKKVNEKLRSVYENACKTLVILCIMVALFPVFLPHDIQASAKELGARHFGMFICWSPHVLWVRMDWWRERSRFSSHGMRY